MIKLEKTTKTNLKAKGLQMVDGNITDPETGEIVNLNTIIQNTFGNDCFDFSFTTSVKEESEVDVGEQEKINLEDFPLGE